jgi:hypothetical protein
MSFSVWFAKRSDISVLSSGSLRMALITCNIGVIPRTSNSRDARQNTGSLKCWKYHLFLLQSIPVSYNICFLLPSLVERCLSDLGKHVTLVGIRNCTLLSQQFWIHQLHIYVMKSQTSFQMTMKLMLKSPILR